MAAVEAVLQVEPELRRIAEIAGQPLRDAPVDGSSRRGQLDDCAMGDFRFTRQLVGADRMPDQQFLQVSAGMMVGAGHAGLPFAGFASGASCPERIERGERW